MKRILSVLFAAWLLLQLQAQTLTVNVSKPRAAVNPDMYGIFFEDINFGADGGLYAEMVKNRSFEFPQNLQGWKTFGNVTLLDDGPFERNPHYVRLAAPSHPHKRTGLENEGFFGMGIEKDSAYRFSVWARSPKATTEKITVELIDLSNNANYQALAAADLQVSGSGWNKYEVILKPGRTEAHAHLRIFLSSGGELDLEHVSLFPVNTFNRHENGMRADLAQALADLHPGVFRFPGGCIIEGTEITDRYDWKKSVGPVENRPLNLNRWQYTFPHRFFADYYQSYGLGFYEFFVLAEEIGAAPLPVLNCGLVCQYQNDNESAHVPVTELEPFIQDAIDLVEFANGDTTTEWGRLRAEMGHPAPFGLKYLAIGNEQWDVLYVERLARFVEVLRRECPDIQIIGSSGSSSDGEQFDYLWPEMARLKVDMVDEHYYKHPKWFLENAARYDNYDRKGPKVFAGEYAAHADSRANNWESALAEAAFLTGVERNADIVRLATYAPLFAHVDGWQWRPDMIWFDNLRCVRTPNYYVQQLYARNKGTHVLSLTSDSLDLRGQKGIYASAVLDKDTETLILKIANTSAGSKTLGLDVKGLGKKYVLPDEAACTVLSALSADMENTLDVPDAIVPKNVKWRLDKRNHAISVPENSFVVVQIKLGN